MSSPRNFRRLVCRNAAELTGIASWLQMEADHIDHWLIITDRAHRVRRIRGAKTLEQLADRVAKARLDGRCFAVVSRSQRAADEETVVAEWRLKRLADRHDSCFFGWAVIDDRTRKQAPPAAA